MKIDLRTYKGRRIIYLTLLVAANIYVYMMVNNLLWNYDGELCTEHYAIRYTCSLKNAEHIARVSEGLYAAYSEFFKPYFSVMAPSKPMIVNVYATRDEYQSKSLFVPGYAEAYYRLGKCNQYFDETAINPHHWFVHEATHQLNDMAAHLEIPRWINEGIATFFGTSRIDESTVITGDIDVDSYPIWWIGESFFEDQNKNDKKSHYIPLETIIRDSGGPSMNTHLNAYYIEWWGLTYFLFCYDNGKYRDKYIKLIREGGTLEKFEKIIGPVSVIEKQWFEYMKNDIVPLLSEKRKTPKVSWAFADKIKLLKKH